jgi:hypothetical protein
MAIYVKTEDFNFDSRVMQLSYSLTNVADFVDRNGVDVLAYNIAYRWLCRTPEMAEGIGADGPFTAIEFH